MLLSHLAFGAGRLQWAIRDWRKFMFIGTLFWISWTDIYIQAEKGEQNLQIKLGTASRAALPPLNVVHGEAGSCQSPPSVNPTLSRASTELRNNQWLNTKTFHNMKKIIMKWISNKIDRYIIRGLTSVELDHVNNANFAFISFVNCPSSSKPSLTLSFIFLRSGW